MSNVAVIPSIPQELHVISTDDNRVVAAVQEWNQNETYNLYVSDTSGVFYTLALESVVSSMGLEGNVMVDLYEVNPRGLRRVAVSHEHLFWKVKNKPGQ